MFNELKQKVLDCTACHLRSEALTPVPADLVQSRVMIVGRNPGRDENDAGRPFIGPGGSELNRALVAAGIDRTKVTITNLAKCYTTGDRPPELNAYATCYETHLINEIKLIKPAFVIALGNDAFRFLANTTVSVNQCRQQFFDRMVTVEPAVLGFEPQSFKPPVVHAFKVLGTLHPGSALRNLAYKVAMYEDLAWFCRVLPEDIQAEIRI